MQSLCGPRVAAALLAAAACCTTSASASSFREVRRGVGTLAADDGDGRKGGQAGASAPAAADGAKQAPAPAAAAMTGRWWGRPASLMSVKGLVRFGTLARLREVTAAHGPLLTGLSTLALVLAVWVTRGFQRGKGFGGCGPVAAAAAAVAGGSPTTGGNAVEPLRACVRRTAHTLSARELEGALDSSLEHASLGMIGGLLGVDEAALLRQRELFGENRLTPPQRESPFVLLLKQIFGGLFNIMLWVCVACELVLALALDGDDIVTPAVLSAVIVASGALQWWTERQAENMMNALQGMQAASRVLVHRSSGGRPVELEVPAEDLVPGDVVMLEAGQRVPADVRILACSDGALVENSALTGESVAEPRTSEVAPSGQALMEARNVAFCGTVVIQGKLLCVVFGTGDNTLLGQIAAKIRTSRTRSSLEIQIEHFVHLIALVAVGVGLFSLAANVVSPRKRNVAEILENAATAFFAQVPEGLLPTVTVCLMIASKQMAKRQVLVRKIDAVETLGCIGVLCSDKTGTLTSGNMTATDFAVPPAQGPVAEVEETAAAPDEDSECGEEGLLEVQPASCEAPSDALAALARCGLLNNATRPEKGGGTGLVGSPTEVAILAGCRRILGDRRADAVSAAFPQVFEIPFNSGSKWMLTIHLVTASAREEMPGEEVPTDSATFVAVLKGAPERVLKLCTAEPETCARADVSLNRLMSQGKRVLCLAEKMLHGLAPDFKFSGTSPEDANFAMEGFTFKGLVALEDPPKPGAADAVARIARAGARTVMVTGDHPATAEAIARRIGVIPAACGSDGVAGAYLVITGAALEEHLPPNDCFDFTGAEKDSEMALFWTRCVEHTCVFARVSPMHKRTIVRAFQQIGGHVVAMTGDGVNDAPALKEAEVGIAMGVRGTEVAKEAADIVLLDDDLQSVVAGMEQGRLCSENLRKSIMYTLCSKLPQVLPTFFELAGVPSALSAAQVLLIDIGTDIWTAIAFAWQPAEGELMLRPPRHPRRDRMVDGQVLFYSYAYIGVIQSAACWLVFFGAIPRMYELFLADKHPSEYSVADSEADYVGMTSYYWTLVLGQVGAALAATTTRQSALQGWAPNVWLTACIAGEILLALLVVMWAPLQQLFKTRGLSFAQLMAGLLGFVLVSAVEELRKMWLRRQDFNAAGRLALLAAADAKACDPDTA